MITHHFNYLNGSSLGAHPQSEALIITTTFRHKLPSPKGEYRLINPLYFNGPTLAYIHMQKPKWFNCLSERALVYITRTQIMQVAYVGNFH